MKQILIGILGILVMAILIVLAETDKIILTPFKAIFLTILFFVILLYCERLCWR